MPRRDEVTFVLHGLDIDARNVRADVFAQKLRTLLAGFREADRFANDKAAFIYMVSNLSTAHSAAITVREKLRSSRHRPDRSGIDVYEEAASAVYNGDRSILRYPKQLVRQIERLGAGVQRNFSHGEIAFSDDNIIRIDDFLARQTEVAQQLWLAGPAEAKDRFYRGLAIGSFDGELKEIDARGTVLRGKLILTAGDDIEIDCVMNRDRIPQARECFDKRVIVEGTAHYDGEQQLPTRIDVNTIRIAREAPDLARWRGAFSAPRHEEDINEEW